LVNKSSFFAGFFCLSPGEFPVTPRRRGGAVRNFDGPCWEKMLIWLRAQNENISIYFWGFWRRIGSTEARLPCLRALVVILPLALLRFFCWKRNNKETPDPQKLENGGRQEKLVENEREGLSASNWNHTAMTHPPAAEASRARIWRGGPVGPATQPRLVF